MRNENNNYALLQVYLINKSMGGNSQDTKFSGKYF